MNLESLIIQAYLLLYLEKRPGEVAEQSYSTLYGKFRFTVECETQPKGRRSIMYSQKLKCMDL